MADEAPSIWDVDGGRAARSYADCPYLHHTAEIYPLFGDLLAPLGDGIRVLDIGAGPGHLAVEFHTARPDSTTRWVLLDEGRPLLDIARERLDALGVEAEYVTRSFNRPGWHEGLGQFDAVVSTLALFHLAPGSLGGFYKTVYALLRDDGLLLNVQSFGFEDPDFAAALDSFPSVLAYNGRWSEEERRQIEQARRDHKRRMRAAEASRETIVKGLRAEGKAVPDEAAYASLHVPAGVHLNHMRGAGFGAECIWRKMEFAVLVGLKGHPYGTRDT